MREQIRTSWNYQHDYEEKVLVKPVYSDCPNCLGSGHVVMGKGPEERGSSWWSECPACNKRFK